MSMRHPARTGRGSVQRTVGAIPFVDGARIGADFKILLESSDLSPDLLDDEVREVYAARERLRALGDALDPLRNANSFALTAGQVMQLAGLFSGSECSLDPFQQQAVVVQHHHDGPVGPALYAQKDGHGPLLLLDGAPTNKGRL